MTICEFIEIYHSYFSRLKIYASEYVALEDAENIVQDVFIQLLERSDIILPKTDGISYLFVATKNRCLNHLRHNAIIEKHNGYIKSEMQSGIDEALSLFLEEDMAEPTLRDMTSLIEEVFASLPQQCRKIFVESRLNGKKHKEIAQEMNLSVKTVEAQIRIARKKIKENFKDIF